MKSINDPQIQVLTVYYYQRYSNSEIAEKMKMSRAWVDKWTSKLELKKRREEYETLKNDNLLKAELLINKTLITMDRGGISNRKRSVLTAAIADLKSYLALYQKPKAKKEKTQIQAGKINIKEVK